MRNTILITMIVLVITIPMQMEQIPQADPMQHRIFLPSLGPRVAGTPSGWCITYSPDGAPVGIRKAPYPTSPIVRNIPIRTPLEIFEQDRIRSADGMYQDWYEVIIGHELFWIQFSNCL